MRVPRSIEVSRPLWQWAQEYSAEFQRDLWRVVLMRRLFAETKRRAMRTLLVPAVAVFLFIPLLLGRYAWAPYALCAYLLVLAVATHRFGMRLRSIAGEAKRLYRLRPNLWREVQPKLNELLARERPEERTLQVQVAPPDAE